MSALSALSACNTGSSWVHQHWIKLGTPTLDQVGYTNTGSSWVHQHWIKLGTPTLDQVGYTNTGSSWVHQHWIKLGRPTLDQVGYTNTGTTEGSCNKGTAMHSHCSVIPLLIFCQCGYKTCCLNHLYILVTCAVTVVHEPHALHFFVYPPPL